MWPGTMGAVYLCPLRNTMSPDCEQSKGVWGSSFVAQTPTENTKVKREIGTKCGIADAIGRSFWGPFKVA